MYNFKSLTRSSSAQQPEEDFYGEVIGQKCYVRKPAKCLLLPKKSHHVGPTYYWQNPSKSASSLKKCVKTSSNCKSCQHQLSKYFDQHSLEHSKELGEDYLKDLAYLMSQSLENKMQDICSRNKEDSHANLEIADPNKLALNMTGTNEAKRGSSPDIQERHDKAQYSTGDSSDDFDIHVPSSREIAQRNMRNFSSDSDDDSPGKSHPNLSLMKLKDTVERVPHSPCNKTFLAVRDLKEAIFTMCTNKCNCLEKPLGKLIKGCTRADQAEILKTYHHIPLGFRIVRLKDVMANLDIIYHRVMDQHGQIASTAEKSCSVLPDPDLIPMGDLISCFPFVKTTIEEMIHQISKVGLKKASDSFRVGISKLTVDQACYRMSEKEKAGVLLPDDKNWNYITSNTLVVSWTDLKKHLGHWVSAPEEIVLENSSGGSSLKYCYESRGQSSASSHSGRRKMNGAKTRLKPTRPKATPIHVTLSPEHDLAARNKQKETELAKKYPSRSRAGSARRGSPSPSAKSMRGSAQSSPQRAKSRATPVHTTSSRATPVHTTSSRATPVHTTSSRATPVHTTNSRETPVPTTHGGRETPVSAVSRSLSVDESPPSGSKPHHHIEMDDIPKSTSTGLLKGSSGRVSLAYAARPKSSPSPMARLREDIKRAVIESQTKRTRRPSAKCRSQPGGGTGGGAGGTGGAGGKQRVEKHERGDSAGEKEAAPRHEVETWMGKEQGGARAANQREHVHVSGGVGEEAVSFHDMLVQQQRAFKQETANSLQLLRTITAEMDAKSPGIPPKTTAAVREQREHPHRADKGKGERKDRVQKIENAVKLTYTSRSNQTQSKAAVKAASSDMEANLRRSDPNIQYIFTREERIKRYLLKQAKEQGMKAQDYPPGPGELVVTGNSNHSNHNNHLILVRGKIYRSPNAYTTYSPSLCYFLRYNRHTSH